MKHNSLSLDTPVKKNVILVKTDILKAVSLV